MSESIIKVSGLGKKYTIGHERLPYHSLRDDLVGLVKKPIRWLRGHKETHEPFWALKDVNFEVKRGEVLGIIGANGAGKSTLLKILSRITYPTEGEVRMQGRVGSLLEVGTGFHPELTGRENIYLNGVILGMTKKEIDKKFDEIIKFAGIERFLDTPVKHYSSGMYVRLAFSVAAHLEPDILIVDEVLAVGDAEFQKKCLGKMEEITKKEGRTILFVSHNMGAIKNLCERGVLLDVGKMKVCGNIEDVAHAYLDGIQARGTIFGYPEDKQKKAKFRKILIKDEKGTLSAVLKSFKQFSVEIQYDVNIPLVGTRVVIRCTDSFGNIVFISADSDEYVNAFQERFVGHYCAIFRFPCDELLSLNKGSYFLEIDIGIPGVESFDRVSGIPIVIDNGESKFALIDWGRRDGLLLLNGKWETYQP